MSKITTGSDLERAYWRRLQTSLKTFAERAFAELNPGKEFVPEYHREAIAYQLERTLAGRNTRYIATLPPRAGKTELISIAFPAFALMLNPSLRFILTTYGGDLAGELMDKFQTVINSEFYAKVAPHTRFTSGNRQEIKTSANGGLLALGMGGALTGRGADIIIVDDIMKAIDTPSEATRKTVQRFFDETLYSRLDSKEKGSIILVQQRLHAGDLIGAETAKGGWNHQNFPAIAKEDEDIPLGKGKVHHRRAGEVLTPDRESLASLEQTRSRMGSPAFATQYNGEPAPAHGNMIQRDWILYWTRLPHRDECKVVMSLDTAGNGNPNSCYSVCTVWWQHGLKHYLVDVMRERLDYNELRARMIKLHTDHKPDITLIENKVIGMGLADDLRKNWLMNVKLIDPKGDKEGRLSLVLPIFEGGQVYLPAQDVPWIEVYLAEMLGFPSVSHDDQVDSSSQYFNWVRSGSGGGEFSYSFVDRNNPDPHGGNLWNPLDHAYPLSSPRIE